MRYTVTTFKVRLEVCEPGEIARCSEHAWRIAKPIFANLDADREHFVVLGLNQRNRIIGHKEISSGTLTSSLVNPSEVFTATMRLRVPAIICCHNHPSGDPMPSMDDQEITRRIKECADMMMIRFLDHIILGHERFFSSLFMLPWRFGIWGGVADYWVCWDNRIALMHHRSWLGKLLRGQDEPSWGPAFYDQIEDIRVVPRLGADHDELIIIFNNGRPAFSLRAPRKNVEALRSIILPRLHVH